MRPPAILAKLGLGVIVALAFGLPYTAQAHRHLAPFAFPLATVAILALLRSGLGTSAWERLGLRARSRLPLVAAALLLVSYLLATLTVDAAAADHAEQVRPVRHGGFAVAQFAFQALNEELLLGTLPLLALARRWPRHPRSLAVGLAAVFALLHFAMYRFGALQVTLGGWTLLTLFAVGVLRGALILGSGSGSVYLAWGLHAGWNLAMFQHRWLWIDSGEPLHEAATFDLLLGDRRVAAVTMLAALVACVVLRPPRRGAI